jgi:hypothetical protein
VTSAIDVEWDVDLWANRYPIHDLAIYNGQRGNDPEDKLRALWQWKSLHRANYDLEDVLPYLDDARDLRDAVEESVADGPLNEVTDAFTELRSRLTEPDGPLTSGSRVIVTPQFLLHLADSRGTYSGRFPILDVMVARAHRTHTAEDDSRTLQDSLMGSEQAYQRLVGYFFERCDSAAQVVRLERALFVQGQAIGRYREIESEYNKVRNVPVAAARGYLDEIVRQTNG